MRIVNRAGRDIVVEEMYATRTSSMFLLGRRKGTSDELLEDISPANVPSKWRGYPLLCLGLGENLSEPQQSFPDVLVVALLVSMRAKNTLDSVLVATWLQGSMFEPPPEFVAEQVRNLDWDKVSATEEYYG